MKKQTSFRNPPSTNYERPTERKFYVWQDRAICWSEEFARKHDRERHPWRWLCTFCDPPTAGFRTRKGAFNSIMTSSMPRHFFVRRAHHKWAASR